MSIGGLFSSSTCMRIVEVRFEVFTRKDMYEDIIYFEYCEKS